MYYFLFIWYITLVKMNIVGLHKFILSSVRPSYIWRIVFNCQCQRDQGVHLTGFASIYYSNCERKSHDVRGINKLLFQSEKVVDVSVNKLDQRQRLYEGCGECRQLRNLNSCYKLEISNSEMEQKLHDLYYSNIIKWFF